MRKRMGRGALGLGLIGVVMALTLVIAGAATGDDGDRHGDTVGRFRTTRAVRRGRPAPGSIKIESNQLDRLQRRPDQHHPPRWHAGLVRLGARRSLGRGDGRHRQGRRPRQHLLLRRFRHVRQRADAAAQRRRAEPADQSRRVLLRPEGRADADADGREDAPAARRRSSTAGRSTSRSRWPAHPTRRTATTPSLNLPDGGERLVHLEGDGHALAGADVRRDGHDHARQRAGRVAVTGVDVSDSLPGASIDCGDGRARASRFRPTRHGELRLQRHARLAGGEQHRDGDVGLGRRRRRRRRRSRGPRRPRSACPRPSRTTADRRVARPRRPREQLVDDTYDERWTCWSGTPSPNTGRTNTATVTWDGGTDSDSASVQVGCGTTPPPPPPITPPVDAADGRVHGRAGGRRTRRRRCSS